MNSQMKKVLKMCGLLVAFFLLVIFLKWLLMENTTNQLVPQEESMRIYRIRLKD